VRREVRFLPSDLPSAEMGTAQQEIPMKVSFPVALTAFIAVPLAIQVVSAVAVLPALEKATTEQCKTHDWPAHQHAAHMDFCTSNGYPTN